MWTVPQENVPIKLPKFLLNCAAAASQTAAKKCVRRGNILVNGKSPVDGVNTELQGGECISIAPQEIASARLNVNAPKIKVIFEDADILIVVKPQGIQCFGSKGNESSGKGQNMRSAVLHRTSDCDIPPAIDALRRPRLCHRLDRDTGGILGRQTDALQTYTLQIHHSCPFFSYFQ
jgi:23S rRNA-/tRNA-specific pseudouridylate synthase